MKARHLQNFVRNVAMGCDEHSLIELSGLRISVSLKGNDKSLGRRKTLCHPARMIGILGLHRYIRPQTAPGALGKALDHEKSTHTRPLLFGWLMRHSDSGMRTHQERNGFGVTDSLSHLFAAGIAGIMIATSPQAAYALEICTGPDRAERKVTCLVDGDTGWEAGVKWRLVDVDTPNTPLMRNVRSRWRQRRKPRSAC